MDGYKLKLQANYRIMKDSLLVGVVLYGMMIFLMSCHSRQHSVLCPNKEELNQLRTGDLVFCIGQSTKSDLVRIASSKEAVFSHVGFVVVKDGDAKMVHMSADADVITCEPFSSYATTSNASSLTFYRIKSLNTPYQLQVRLDSLLARKVPFDHHYDFHNSEKLYCTELIVKSLKAVRCEVFKHSVSNKYIYPDDLLKISGLEFLFSIK